MAEPEPQGEGALRWSPDVLDLGEVEVGDDAAVDLLLENVGDAPLRALAVGGLDHPDLVLTPTGPPRFLDVGESTSLRLHFRPSTDATLDLVLVLRSDDPAGEGAVAVRGEGLGAVPTLRFVEGPDEVVVGCDAPLQFVLGNVGRGGVVTNRAVSILGDDRAAFSSLRPEDETWTLHAGEETAFAVRFAPERVGDHLVTVRADGPEASDEASALAGAGAVAGPLRSDRFVQSAGTRADLLFVVDDSPGMDHEALLDGAQALADALDGHGLDWHVGVVSTDVAELGVLRGPPAWVHADHEAPGPALEAAFDVGDDGSEIEQGLHQALLALSPPTVDGVNAGFLRDEALLHLVFVSDEDDSSEPASGWNAAQYASFFAGLKASTSDVVVSDISGGSLGCGGVRDAAPAPRYGAVTAARGGVAGSFCAEDWRPALEAVAGVSRRRMYRFELSRPALPGSVSVRVDGEATEATYDETTGEVVFPDGAAPRPDAAIDVDYAELGCR